MAIFLSTAIIIDLIIAAVLVISFSFGIAKGMVRGLLTLVGMILALIVASRIADVTVDLVIEQVIRPATYAAVEQNVDDIHIENFSGIEQIEQIIDAIENDLIREQARGLIAGINIPTGELTRDKVLEIGFELVDAALRGPVRDILSALICILCFALVSLLLRPVIWTIEQAFRLPLLRQINQIGGFFFGAIRGVLLVLVGVWALRLTGMYVTEDVIAESWLLKYAVQLLDAFGSGISAVQ